MTQTEATAIRVSKGTRDALKDLFPGSSADEAVAMLLTSYRSRRPGRGAVTPMVPVVGRTESDGVDRLSADRLNAGRAAASGSAVRS